MGGDAIAVVGMAGRFPGAPDVAALWRNLLGGVDAVHDHTPAELRELGVGERLIADPAHVPAHGRLEGVADFDAEFFGVPDAEAVRMDPQQRLFLEQAWAALEDAGHDPAARDGIVGVFAGSSLNRYFLFRQFGNPSATDDWESLLLPGSAADYLPAQVAYRLGLTGPAIATQTACSSSLVAVCTAAQSLLDYRCDLALAGGVSVTEPRFRHTPGGLVSPDGRCRAFDAAGQGAAYGSGVAVLALKRLEDAQEDGDQVLAVLRGWAVGNDGAARAGFAAPGLDGQAAVVAEALASAEASPADIGYVEAHGSGTLAGDAIEVAALARAFGDGLAPGSCALGSLKTNLGNLDAAAGAASLIKAVLAVRHGIVPANLHFRTPNPEIDFASSPFFVPVENHPFPAGPRLAGVSSFGLGGTNAHVIVENAPEEAPRAGADGGWHALPVSARTPEALREALTRLADHLAAQVAAGAPPRPDDVARTLAGRRAFARRAAVLCRDVAEAVPLLRAAAGAAPPDHPAGAPAELVARASAWVSGADVEWPGTPGARRVSLPAYPFQRRRHWIEARP
ncbi:beta-ketoacyl synthase N-terminal-like domain-containing protein [Bailinhaonella thermotolerans]|uniref:Polyketide synthase n=1 Tax=Bailinhaonella thermotolerans TaxID=1070861 RepID=A0A3A4A6L4_9ACTN|nr:polyketide synthase [Bailinhaonella thermotolerans]RJL21438.1 polyketide synthase [Bailinhaonella thermotolerans]